MDPIKNPINTTQVTSPFSTDINSNFHLTETEAKVVELFKEFAKNLETNQRGLFIYQPTKDQAILLEMGTSDETGFTKPCSLVRCGLEPKAPLEFAPDSSVEIAHIFESAIGPISFQRSGFQTFNNVEEATNCYFELEKELTTAESKFSYLMAGFVNTSSFNVNEEIVDLVEIAYDRLEDLEQETPLDIEFLPNLNPSNTEVEDPIVSIQPYPRPIYSEVEA